MKIWSPVHPLGSSRYSTPLQIFRHCTWAENVIPLHPPAGEGVLNRNLTCYKTNNVLLHTPDKPLPVTNQHSCPTSWSPQPRILFFWKPR